MRDDALKKLTTLLDQNSPFSAEVRELESQAEQALQALLEAHRLRHGDSARAERALQRYLAYFAINYLGCEVNDAHRVWLNLYRCTVH